MAGTKRTPGRGRSSGKALPHAVVVGPIWRREFAMASRIAAELAAALQEAQIYVRVECMVPGCIPCSRTRATQRRIDAALAKYKRWLK